MNNVVSLPRKTIAHGPNAGLQQCSADLVLDNLTAAKDVIVKLKANGFVVIATRANIHRATVEVQKHPLIAELVEKGEAGYFLRDRHFRHGEFYGEANDGRRVRIVWVERQAS